MKNYIKISLFTAFLLFCWESSGQESFKSDSRGKMKPLHISLDNFPTDQPINYMEGWGGMVIAVNEMPAGTDFGPLLKGLKNDSCQVPHWGYLLKGAVRLIYDDGTEEVLREGDIFYMRPGHIAVVEEDVKMLDFSPQQEFKNLVEHIEKKMAESPK
ncbi:MAG: hypothetical protein WD431_18790 [Cyclobacteriaceae bacterium]